MDQHDDFDSVSWRHDAGSDVSGSRPTTSGTDAEESPGLRHDVNGKRRMSSAGHEPPQAAPLADAVDLAGIADGVLECQIDSPLKENDGTKDAYISYLVTTHVGLPLSADPSLVMKVAAALPSHPILTSREIITDRFQILPETRIHREKTIHRFFLPIQDAVPGVSRLRGPAAAGQA